ncbi:hypothetical protein [Candidatus Ichthyocystis hellenicum]|uniref:hypothetical protein n=1 Tax=Candidatus Ichthyocystis hellenicum TaxID=1561003 RepID=UPI001111D6D6|nr:hypothetical protein [Candidatus Ichthyocystis hellenicum]
MSKGSQMVMDGVMGKSLCCQDEDTCCYYAVDDKLSKGYQKLPDTISSPVQYCEKQDKKKIKSHESLDFNKHFFSLVSRLRSKSSPENISCSDKNSHIVSCTFSSSNYYIHKRHQTHSQMEPNENNVLAILDSVTERVSKSVYVPEKIPSQKLETDMEKCGNIISRNRFYIPTEEEKEQKTSGKISTNPSEYKSAVDIKRSKFILDKTESVITRLEHYIYCANYFSSYYRCWDKNIIGEVCSFFLNKSIAHDGIICRELTELSPTLNDITVSRVVIANRKIKKTITAINNIMLSEKKTAPAINYRNEKLDTTLQIDIIVLLARHFSHLYCSDESRKSLSLLLSMLTEISRKNFSYYVKELENLNSNTNISQINQIDVKISEAVLKISNILSKL